MRWWGSNLGQVLLQPYDLSLIFIHLLPASSATLAASLPPVIANYPVSTSTYMDLPDRNRRLSTCGIVYNTNKEKSIDCYKDSDFSGAWAQEDINN